MISKFSRSPLIRKQLFTKNFGSVPELIQSTIVGIQSFSGLPWWATIAGTTIVVKSTLIPLVRLQMISSRKFSNAIPEISQLFHLLKFRLQGSDTKDFKEITRIWNIFRFGVSASLRLHDVSLFEFILYPVTNAAIFITFIYSLRDLMINQSEIMSITDTGFFWLEELTEKDSMRILPMVAVTSSYAAMELAFVGHPKSAIVKDFFQCIVILSLVPVTGLPSGVFFYWIPSSVFGMMQAQIMKIESVQKFLGIPIGKSSL